MPPLSLSLSLAPRLFSTPLRSLSRSSQRCMASLAQLQAGGIVDDLQGLHGSLALCGALSVEYPSGGFSAGELVPAPHTHVLPSSVRFQADEDNSGKVYTVIMTDPDAPDRTEHLFREFIHYVVKDVTAESLSTGGPLQGTTVMDYLGVGAPHGSGLHRYVFLLFEQPDGATPANLSDAFEGRGGKKACVSAQENGLGPIVGATWLESEWHESIDAIHEGMGWLPPPQFRSPKQREANP